MPAATLVGILESLSALLVFAILVFWLIPNYRLDLFRQETFCVRDELFDYARAGNISFSHPAYRLLRQSANGFIRYAHRLTFYRVIMTVIIWRAVGHTPELVWTKQWEKALTSLDDRVKADMVRYHERLFMLVTKRLVLGSPLLIALLIVTAIVMLCKVGLMSIREALKASAKKAVDSVIDTRLLEEEAAETARAVAA